jgi:hypothetical protein
MRGVKAQDQWDKGLGAIVPPDYIMVGAVVPRGGDLDGLEDKPAISATMTVSRAMTLMPMDWNSSRMVTFRSRLIE